LRFQHFQNYLISRLFCNNFLSDDGFEQDSSVFGNHLINFCHRIKAEMITDDSLDNLQVRGFPFRGKVGFAVALPTLL
jgi:hypothetical protein